MKTRLIEVTNGPQNWGKFLLGVFDESETRVVSAVAPGAPLLRQIGWGTAADCVWVLDLQTREGACFYPRGDVAHDLDKHRVWVCPMFQPFLEWLYAQPDPLNLDALPVLVDLPEAEFAFSGYRRRGPDITDPREGGR